MHWGRHLVTMLRTIEILAKPGGASIRELGKKVEVNRRTAYRIMETLEELNFPIVSVPSRLDGQARYRLVESYIIKLPNLIVPDLKLTSDEIIALYFIRGYAHSFKGSTIESNIGAAYAKFDAFVPEDLAKRLNKIKNLFLPAVPPPKDYSCKQEIIDSLTDAIISRKTCWIEYQPFDNSSIERSRIDPLCFTDQGGCLCVRIRYSESDQVKVLTVERIKKVTVEETSFELPNDLNRALSYKDKAKSPDDKPTNFKIRFSANVAQHAQKCPWGGAQKATKNTDGSVLLELNSSEGNEIRCWILSLGPEVEVLQPKQLRKEIVESLQQTLKKYY